ncbi:hypothetical protein BBJ29_008164 [Phytophthora kernoviae]|uniref:glucan endo-1,3-beta-D-glucosidase n=1 Tax=Phytophthora kernoviae TaxID=325452 RepID=A0A3F2RJ06_9STRA|nr:hypothetical protein BBJ29_008164 [Phytophthora kernoviae]RLN58203.1 hypothetical protein BBP00_00007136 [Phytophthora kernoviae]
MASDSSVVGADTLLLAYCLEKLEAMIEPVLNNTLSPPLVYETLYNGIVSKAIFDTGILYMDFGNGIYNDHHYHYGYFVTASAILKHLDPTWSRMPELETMIWMMLRDVANPSADDVYFPRFRHFSWYLGHSYSRGVTLLDNGKDEESTSEDINFYYGMTLWGKVTGKKAVEDLGSLMLRLNARAVRTYFLLRSDNTIHPPEIVRNRVTGIFFDNKVYYNTWFLDKTYAIHGIQMIPVSPINELARTPEFVAQEWNDVLSKDPIVVEVDTTVSWLSVLLVNAATVNQTDALHKLKNATLDNGLSRSWALYNAATRCRDGLKLDPSTTTKSSKASLDHEKWGHVKTWTFAQLLASSFAKVKLEDAVKNGGNSLKGDTQKTPSSGNNDWDCSYSCLPTVPPPTISASSSSSTLLSDLDMHHRHSLEELLEHALYEETVEEELEGEAEEDPARCRDPTRYVFDIVRIIGSGSYGTVLLCRLRACPNRLFAVKVVYKSKLGGINGLDGDRDTSREANRLLTEKKVLCSVTHPFITKMFCSFETPDALNFVLEYCPGGDMYFLLEKFAKNRLPEDHVLFYAASIALALRYLHERGIMYRDLKPENILLDEAGFLRLADFGFAREQMHRSEQNCKSFCGSADYIAPEVVRGDGYGLAADLWSFGCVVFELLTGFPPFYSPRDRALLYRKIEESEPCFPSHFSPVLCDFLSGLLHKDVNQRLGNGPNGMQDILDHPFFAKISWQRLEAKQVVPPLVPNLTNKLDTSNFEEQFTSQQVEGHLVYEERDLKGGVVSEEEDHFYFPDFDWCAEPSHFQ